MLRRIGEAVTVLSLLFIAGTVLFGGMYLGIQSTGTLPSWAGNIFTAFAGGILALLGTMFAAYINRQLERRKLEHEQAAKFAQPYREFLIALYSLLSRKVYAQTAANNFLAEKIKVSPEEVNRVLKLLPPLASNYLIQKREFQLEVESSILDGITLLESKVDRQFLDEFERWSKNSRAVIQELNEYENQVFQ